MLHFALKEAQEQGAQKTAFLHLIEGLEAARMPFCIHCSNPCSGRCYEGTALEDMLHQVRKADGIIVGSPSYFATTTATLKAFWDKTRRLRKEQALLDTVGGVFAVGNSRFGGQETTLRAVQDMLLAQGVTVVGDGHQSGDPGHQGACAQQPVDQDPDTKKRTLLLIRRIVAVARATKELRLQIKSQS